MQRSVDRTTIPLKTFCAALIALVTVVNRYVVERLPSVPAAFVTVSLLVLVYLVAEQFGRRLDLDVDLGFLLMGALGFLYALARFARGLISATAGRYESAAHLAINMTAVLIGAGLYMSRRTTGMGAIALLPLAVYLAGSCLRRQPRDQPLRQMYISTGSLLASALVAWAAASLFSIVVTTAAIERPRLVQNTIPEQPIIAITLSGGGYRAAVAHAGVLWVLDEAGLPPRILSTVSGGSIVGSAYSLGWSPRQFRDRLMLRKPYLTSDLLNIVPVVISLLPFYGTGDTFAFAFHLASRFFGLATLDDAKTRTLLINLTHYESGRRVVYASEDVAATRPADPLLARAVAASAAFPGAFAPVRLGNDYFMDGGVRENLGVEGLARYFAANPSERDRVRLVIVSNMGLETSDRQPLCQRPSGFSSSSFRELRQPTAVDGALRAFDILYDRAEMPLQRQYLSPRSAKDGHCMFHDDTGSRPHIPAVYLSTFSGRGWESFPKDTQEEVVQVMSLPALHELSSRQAAVAFWAGARLMADMLPDVCTYVGRTPCSSINVDSLKPK